jgi:alpha-galactosidase
MNPAATFFLPWRTTGRLLLACLLMGAAAVAQAQTIRYDATTRVFRIDTDAVSYAFGVNENDQLQTLYWGARLATSDALPAAHTNEGNVSFDPPASTSLQEYAGWGGSMYVEPDLKLRYADGNRDLVLHYVSHRIKGDTLDVHLRDIRQPLDVTLHYVVDPATGIIGRSALIENHTKQAVTIDSVAAASWNLPAAEDYSLRYLTGRWAGEWQLQTRAITPGNTVLESRRGSTGHENNPWFAIERGGDWAEDHGDVWFGALAWSGSWRITVEQGVLHQVRVTGGFNPFDFAWPLAPGESVSTPVFYAGYTSGGIGEASRLLHRFELAQIVPQHPKPRLRPVLYNSWEATNFAVDQVGQEHLAELAASIGVERFVMDDGWFGARNDDHAGLGDWVVNPKKFPHGLKPLIDKVHALKMDFGLWVEPEMVNPDSDLYRAHPDWVLNFTDRPRSEGRNQLVLNLARQDVRDHVFKVLDDLLSHNDIAFLKWDYNRNWSEPGWPQVAPDQQQKVYVDYVRNLYGILAELRRRHPNVEIESCSGGGGRVDLGILGHTDQVWPSDNTDPFDRLSIQDGFSYAYAPAVMMAWVTDSPNWVNDRRTSLDYRFLSSMQGSLGIGANLLHWTAQDFATAKKYVAEYKAIRASVQQGRLYRLLSPRDNSPHAATESVSRDGKQAVLFAFLHAGQMKYPYPRVRLQGLDPDARYRWRSLHGAPVAGTLAEASGAYWMNHGIDLALRGDYQAAAIVFDRVGGER